MGAMVNGKPIWTLVAHAGTVAHSHLMVSLVHAHYINQGIIENKKLSINVVDESWLKEADRMGVISGNKEDKGRTFHQCAFWSAVRLYETGRAYGDVL